MPSLFRFGKSSQGNNDDLHERQRSNSTSFSRDRTTTPVQRAATTVEAAPPKLVLTTTEDHDAATMSPASVHRPGSLAEPEIDMGPSSEEEARKKERRKSVKQLDRRTLSAAGGGGAGDARDSNDDPTTPTPRDIPNRTSGEQYVQPQAQPTGTRSRSASVVDDAPAAALNQNGSQPSLNGHDSSSSLANRRASAASVGSIETPAYRAMKPIVESPPPIDQAFPRREPTEYLSSPEHADDAQSIRSAKSSGKDKEKKRTWKRSMTSLSAAAAGQAPPASGPATSMTKPKRQPSGLASAIAASGMAMANPAVNNATLSPKLLARKGSTASLQPIPNISSVANPAPVRGPARQREPSTSSSTLEPSDDSSDGYESPSGLSLNEDDNLITGFAVASSKRNADFHDLFPSVDEGDYLIEDYGCALQREILIQGRLYISENHMCFHANIFGWVTNLIIPFCDVTALEKKMTAFVIPNAIQISTHTTKYTFASFLSRDTTYDVIHNIWRLSKPEGSSLGPSPRGSIEAPNGLTVATSGLDQAGAPGGAARKKATVCACSKDGSHYPQICMDTTFPGTPEQIYNLMFASGFIKDFMSTDQKLMEIQMSDWAPKSGTSEHLLSRTMSYIKPLTGSFGPKQTKCELTDENLHVDYDEYVSTMTTTRTPDVPSGGVFSAKTRTCFMWAGRGMTRVIITCAVEWTGKSFIKSIIERSVADGNKTYADDLERAMRAYIADHRTEFVQEGAEEEAAEQAAAAAAASPTSPTTAAPPEGSEEARRARDKERSQRSLQWALDTFEAATKVAKDSIMGLWDLFIDSWEQSSRTTILYIVIAILVISNIWTLMLVGNREEVGRRRALERREGERERWVGDAVRAFMEAQESMKSSSAMLTASTLPVQPVQSQSPVVPASPLLSVKEEVAEIRRVLEEMEQRMVGLKARLAELD